MANRYLRSTDGSDGDGGTTWALAKATLTGVAAIDTAGDKIYVSSAHSESTAAITTINLAGTNATPSQILSVNDAAEPPTALAPGAIVATTGGAYALTINGAVYANGVTFKSAGYINFHASNTNVSQQYQNCEFWLTATDSVGQMWVANQDNAGYRTDFIDCKFKFGGVGNAIYAAGFFRIEGGSMASGTTSITSMFRFIADRTACQLMVTGFDFSALGTGFNLFASSGIGAGKATFRNCKLPSGWTGLLVASGLVNYGQRFEMHNCDAGDTNYRLWVEDYSGSIKSETVIVRTAGASDGTTALSWVMATSANAEYPLIRLESPEIVTWNDATGSALTATVEIVHDTNVAAGQGAGTGSRFQDDEVWLEVMYLGTSGFPLGAWITDCKADVLATAADQTDSSEAWTTTGLTTPQKQKLSVTFTPQEKGYIHARVVVAKASKTIYVCPKVAVA